MMKNYFKELALFGKSLFLTCFVVAISATATKAQVSVSGTVKDAGDNNPIVGANVIVKGSTRGTNTDPQGYFTVQNLSQKDVLVFSFIGYEPVEIVVGNQTKFDVSLVTDATALDQVTVTALGIKRETRSLGYAAQSVSGDELSQAKDPNLLNNLTGKVAGVNITQGGSGVGSTSRIVIRGETFLSGDNQPLFVVNGVPINNSAGSNGGGGGNLPTDFGNGAADINPEDIESITVLRGANATALYGSRAGNGVILITTKTGANSKGLGVSVSSNTTFENALRIPQYQNSYGQGAGGRFAFVDGSGAGTNDNIDESWGPALDGRLMVQHNSTNPDGIRAGDFTARVSGFGDQNTFQQLPFSPQPDNIKDFFETGITTNNSISIDGGDAKSNFRLSYNNLYSKGILPNTDLKRNGLNLNVGHNMLNNRLHLNTNINYIKSGSKNRPNNSYGTENIMYLWVWFGRHITMSSLENYWQPNLEGIQQFNYNYNWHDNPYFTMFENTNAFNKDRLLGNVNVSYDITKNLSFMVRTGLDVFNDLRTIKRAWSTQRFPKGQYREDKLFFQERNTDFLLSYDNKSNGDFSIMASMGGNQMIQENRSGQLIANELAVPGIYSFNNSNIPLLQNSFNSKRAINSLYASTSLGYKGMFYVDLSGRNDWASTLPKENNSYFYPAASLSVIANEIFDLPRAFSFAKFRLGYGEVGNDTNPYALESYFQFLSSPYGSQLLGTESNQLPNSSLRPERLKTFEIGADIRLFKNRIGLDLTYYNNNASDQIIQIPVSQTSGYASKFINAGKINSQGIEALVNITPVKTNNFTWDMNINYTRARSKVIELTEGIDNYSLSSNYIQVLAKVGGRMGDVYGTGFVLVDPETQQTVTVEDVSEIQDNWGHLYNANNGQPIRDPNLRRLGNYNPDFNIGFNNSFSYKSFDLNFLFDWRQGGVINSRTLLIGGTSGMMAETAEYDRENGTFIGGVTKVSNVPSLNRQGFIQGPDGSFIPNNVEMSARDFYWSHFNRGNEEVGMYDASFVKLRQLSFGYNFNKGLAKALGAQNVRLSVVGRNLLLFTQNPHFDPEVFSFSGSTMVPGVEDMATPSSRSYGFNLNITF